MTMNTTDKALQALNQRIEMFCERIAQAATDPVDPDSADEMPAVIQREVSMLVMDGPDAYLGYLVKLGNEV